MSRRSRVAVAVLALGVLVVWRNEAHRGAATLARGERMYRTGLLESGAPMMAHIRGDIAVEGPMFTCVSCHLRSGLGAVEGQFAAPPVNAESLFRPVLLLYKGVVVLGEPPRRPAYTRETLARALRAGVDPAGRSLREAMPRYELGDQDMSALLGYLELLASPTSVGAGQDTITLATVITDDVSAQERQAMLFVLQKYVAFKNAQTQPREMGVDNRSARMAATMLSSREVTYQRLVLTPWLLHGPPATWREQLEVLYEADPPFALLSGMSTQSWAPIHDFAERHQVPTVLPAGPLPVLRGPDTTTVYASQGVFQEGAGVARYLALLEPDAGAGVVVQLVRDTPIGRALQAGFEATAQELGRPLPRTLTMAPGAPIPEVDEPGLTAILLWDGPGGLVALERLSRGGATVFVSSGAAGDAVLGIPESLRERTAIAWPFRVPAEEAMHYAGILRPWVEAPAPLAELHPGLTRDYRAAAAAYAGTQVLTEALTNLRGHLSRDALLDGLGMLKDQNLPSFERLSFGVGQRTASEGCRIVQLDTGPSPTLLDRSGWLTH